MPIAKETKLENAKYYTNKRCNYICNSSKWFFYIKKKKKIIAIGFEVFEPQFSLSFNLSKFKDFDFHGSKPT